MYFRIRFDIRLVQKILHILLLKKIEDMAMSKVRLREFFAVPSLRYEKLPYFKKAVFPYGNQHIGNCATQLLDAGSVVGI